MRFYGEKNLYNVDCMEKMKEMGDKSVDLLLTDIPYDGVNRDDGGLRKLGKDEADIITFNLNEFLGQVDRITKGTVIIFCGMRQMSEIYNYFFERQCQNKGTVRQLIWEKTNPSPMNGQNVYLSGIENAVWFRKHNGTFNGHCKNTVFRYPSGRSKVHPTEKNLELIKELIADNSNDGDMVFDPCMGSGTHLIVAKSMNRNFGGCELTEKWFNIAKKRITEDVDLCGDKYESVGGSWDLINNI